MINLKKINSKTILRSIAILLSYMIIIPNVTAYLFSILKLDLQNRLIYIIAYTIIYILTLLVIYIFYHKSLKEEFILYKKNFKSFFKIGLKNWLLALLFMFISNSLILSIVGDMATNETLNRSIVNEMPIFSIISMALIGPFIEEVLFRKNFREAIPNDQAFMIITSLLFGGAHLLNAFVAGTSINLLQLLYIIPYSGIGYFFAKSYVETKTIFTSTVTHVMHNSLSLLLVLLSSTIIGG